ncbi:fasciclin-like arabinogalactan protein 10 [Wolffia australiana]
MDCGALMPVFLFAALFLGSTAEAHNITTILSGFPDYSIYNDFLSQTRVADEINGRETVTCLVLANSAMAALAAKRSLVAIKSALRLHTLLDYFDSQKLHDLSRGAATITTLLQTTGAVTGSLGFVNVTDLKDGRVGFASAVAGSKIDAYFSRSVKQMPYSISVLEISAPIVFPGLLDAGAQSDANLTVLLQQAGCKTFSSLVTSYGVLAAYQTAMSSGLTVFAPNDGAFKAAGVPDLGQLSRADVAKLLEYHASPDYLPKASLKVSKGRPIRTLASDGTGRYELTATARGDDVTLNAGTDTSRVASTVVDEAPFCLLTVDSVLLPSELFRKAPSPSAAGPTSSPSPVISPAQSPSPSLSPSLSPEPPGPSPADAPGEEADSSEDTTGEATVNSLSVPRACQSTHPLYNRIGDRRWNL